jgi:hypothetical protein
MDVVVRFRLARAVKRLNKKIAEMEKKLSESENLPIMVETEP